MKSTVNDRSNQSKHLQSNQSLHHEELRLIPFDNLNLNDIDRELDGAVTKAR